MKQLLEFIVEDLDYNNLNFAKNLVSQLKEKKTSKGYVLSTLM